MLLSSAMILAWSFSALGGGAVSTTNGASAAVDLRVGTEWSGASLSLPGRAEERRQIAFSVRNTGTNALTLTLKTRVCERGLERQERKLQPHQEERFVFNLRPKTLPLGFALAGVQGYGTDSQTDGASASRKTCEASGGDLSFIDIFGRSKRGGSFSIANIDLTCGESCRLPHYDGATFFPFCDGYGQFAHSDWPGKIHSDAELKSAGRIEAAWLAEQATSPLASADRFGGWANGPRLAATGRFRVERYRGNWHLVDPEGRLFFSFGLAGVRRPPATKTRGRERFFETLSDASAGRVNFGAANMIRKYGADEDGRSFVARCRSRVRAWGFNTIANWSSPTVCAGAEIPYVDTFTVPGRQLKMPRGSIVDVFDSRFADNVRKAAGRIAPRSANDPWCIGWFVDNELPWGGTDFRAIARAARAAGGEQPAGREWRRFLGGRDAAAATEADLLAFSEHFAETYFRTVRAVLGEVAPGVLYLGCRFATSRTPAEVWKIAARHADVVSVNLYRLSPEAVWPAEVDRPILIGEFHFGALDRGLLHAGCVAAGSQRERADLFARYVRKALAVPNLVGAHWFLYQDQPLTGRERDGEGFQCGFVDVCDSPYAEMVGASRGLAQDLYGLYERKFR